MLMLLDLSNGFIPILKRESSGHPVEVLQVLVKLVVLWQICQELTNGT